MSEDRIFVYSTHKKKNTNNRFQSPMAGQKRVFAGLLLACVALAVGFPFVVPCEAGIVYGHVSLVGGTFPPQGELTFSEARGNRFNVKTDQKGNYNVVLPPGVYSVTFTQGETTWQGTLRSYPNPVKQDIRMTRQ